MTTQNQPITWKTARVSERVLLQAMERLFRDHRELLAFVFDPLEPKLRRPPKVLLTQARAFSTGEALLIRVALDLWNQTGAVSLYEIIERLDYENFEAVTTTLRMLGPKRSSQASLLRAPSRRADGGWDGSLF